VHTEADQAFLFFPKNMDAIVFPSRVLAHNNRDLIERVLIQYAPSKLKIQTLAEVFQAFATEFANAQVKLGFNFTSFQKSPYDFTYDGRVWTATITKEISENAAGKPREFINIKLPNDGFFYTSTYQLTLSLVENEETKLFVQPLYAFFLNIEGFDRSNLKFRINYKEKEARLEVYFEDDINFRTVTIKFVYGTYKYFVDKPAYTLESLKKFLGEA
jgi:hypothetical protein